MRTKRPVACVLMLIVNGPIAGAAWEAGPPLPDPVQPRLFAAGVNQDGTLFAIGGSPFSSDGDDNAAAHYLPPGAPQWQAGAFVEGPIVRQGAGLDALGRIIVFGGRDGIDPEGDTGRAYVYEIIEGQQNDIADRAESAPVDFMAWATDAGGRVYSIGGGPGAAAIPGDPNRVHVERYDGLTDTWTVMAPLPTGVADAAAVFDGAGGILLLGGFDAQALLRRTVVLRYDIASNSWSTGAVPDLPIGLTGLRAVRGADGWIYAIGGVAGPVRAGVTQDAVYVYEPGAAAWSSAPAMAAPRSHFAAMLGDDDFIYVVGGSNDAGGTATVEKLYTPPCPVIVDSPASAAPWQGQTVVLTVAVAGGTPLSYRWHRNGVELQDGPAPGGGTYAGADSTSLTITTPTAADDGLYQLSATNPCGTVTNDGIALAVRVPADIPATWTATNLHPTWALSSRALAASGDRQAGRATFDTPEYAAIDRPVVWQGTAASAIDMTPAGSVGAWVTSLGADVEVGWWWWPYQCQIGGQWYTCYSRQAAAWNGSAASHQNLQVSGWEYSIANDTDGTFHVGTVSDDDAVGNTFAHAGMWTPTTYFVDLHPAGVSKSFGNAIDGDRQYGSINTPYPGPTTHAAMWSGTAASFVDLHPSGASRSWITAAGDGQQVGQAEFAGSLHALVWADAADGQLDLGPGTARDCGGGWQVGSAFVNGGSHAVIWRGDGGAVFDLHAFVDSSFGSSAAYAIDVDTGGTVTIVGAGYNTVTEREEALMWQPTATVACAADLDRSGDVGFADLLVIIGAWGPCTPACPEDLSGNGVVDFADVLAVIGAWGPCAG